MRCLMIPILAGALFTGACSSDSTPKVSGGAVTTTSPVKAAPKMTYADCQKSAEYPGQDGYSGGVYAFTFDNGVCTVQKP